MGTFSLISTKRKKIMNKPIISLLHFSPPHRIHKLHATRGKVRRSRARVTQNMVLRNKRILLCFCFNPLLNLRCLSYCYHEAYQTSALPLCRPRCCASSSKHERTFPPCVHALGRPQTISKFQFRSPRCHCSQPT